MKVTVEISKVLVAIRPGLAETTEIELPEGASVGDALAAAGLPQGLWGIVVIGSRVGTASTKLSPGDKVTVFPPVSGG
ncbi:MAG: MoaD/ThiS family protein [Betaproteobacteria bacterium]